jgi:hypothetical protein
MSATGRWIGAASQILENVPEGVGVLTAPQEAREFVDATKIDVLAPAVAIPFMA